MSSKSSSYKYLLKFVLVGCTGVGKSCLLLQLTDTRFDTTHDPTIGSEFGAKTVTVEKKNRVRLQIWDTAGQERFKSMTASFFRGAAGALLVYDITRKETFDQLPSWLQDLRQLGTENMTIMLVGNKSDLAAKRAVSFQQGQEFAKLNGLLFMECSAKTNHNVLEAFVSTAQNIYMNIKDGVVEPSDVQGIRIGPDANLGLTARARLCCST